MAPLTRRSLRSQTTDHDELADDKIGAASMRQNKLPRPRGRPPKSARQTSTPQRPPPTPQTQLPTPEEQPPIRRGRGRPPGQPAKIYVFEEHDREVAAILNWHMRRPSMGRRMGKAARSVFMLSGKWPWELLAGFLPRKWGIPTMENMRKLFRILDGKLATNDYGENFQVVKDFLRAYAVKRNRRFPHLKSKDVDAACTHFSTHHYSRSEALQKTGIRRLTALVESDDENDENVDDSEDEWEDDDDTAVASQDEASITTPLGKRRRSSSESSQKAQKRARSTESDKGADIQSMSQSAADPTHRPYTLADLIKGLRWLESKEQEKMEVITRSLQETKASIAAIEVSIAEAIHKRASDKETDELRLLIEKTKEEKNTFEKQARQTGKEFWEGNRMDAEGAEVFAKIMQSYSSRLRDYDKYIVEANDKITAKQNKADKEDFDQKEKLKEHKEEEKRLGNRQGESLKKSNHFRVLESLGMLGSSGMADLLANLEARGISLIELAERIMQADDTSALGTVAKFPTGLAVTPSVSI